MKRQLAIVAGVLAITTLAAGWVWTPPGGRLAWGRHTFIVRSDLAANLFWSPFGSMTQNEMMSQIDRALQLWNRYVRANVALEVDPASNINVPRGFSANAQNNITYENRICPGPTCCSATWDCFTAHTYVWPAGGGAGATCDVSWMGTACSGFGCFTPTGWVVTGQGLLSVNPNGLPPFFTFHRTMMHEIVHCLGAFDPYSKSPPCVGPPSTSSQGPANCQEPGVATTMVLGDDVDAVRDSTLGFGPAIDSPIKYAAGTYNGNGSLTLTPSAAFIVGQGVQQPTSVTHPRIDCYYDEWAPDCVMVGTTAAGALKMWALTDVDGAAGAQLSLSPVATASSGRALLGADIAMSRSATFTGAVAVYTDTDALQLVAVRWNVLTNSIVGVTRFNLGLGTLSKYEPRIAYDRFSGTYTIAVIDSVNRFQFFVSNGPNPSAAGFAFVGPYIGSPHPNGPSGEPFFALTTPLVRVEPIGPFDIGCTQQRSNGFCRLVFHSYEMTTQAKQLNMAVCYLAPGPGAIGGAYPCSHTFSNADTSVLAVHDYQSSVAGGPGPGWTMNVARQFPGFTWNTANIFDAEGDWNPSGYATLFDLPDISGAKFRHGGGDASFCRWSGCNREIVLTLGCGGAVSGECL